MKLFVEDGLQIRQCRRSCYTRYLSGRKRMTPMRMTIAMQILLSLLIVSSGKGERQDALLTKSDILNIVRNQQESIQDFSISLLYDKTSRNEADSTIVESKKHEVDLSVKGELFKTRRRNFSVDDPNKVIFDKSYAADGKAVYGLNNLRMAGMVGAQRPSMAPIKCDWAMAYLSNCLIAPRDPKKKFLDGNLVSALASDEYRLLPTLEKYQGRDTYVLEFEDQIKVYLDPKLGFAVAGIVTSFTDGFAAVNSDFKEVADGFWLPMVCTSTRKSNGVITTERISVKEVKINQGLTAKDFKLQFPPDAKVVNKDLKAVLPSASGVAEEYLNEMAANANAPKNIDAKDDPSRTTSSALPQQTKASSPGKQANRDGRQDVSAGSSLPSSKGRSAWVFAGFLPVVFLILVLILLKKRNRSGT